MSTIFAKVSYLGEGHRYSYMIDPKSHNEVYGAVYDMTDCDHEIADDAAAWCELATVGDVYEFRDGRIESEEIDV